MNRSAADWTTAIWHFGVGIANSDIIFKSGRRLADPMTGLSRYL
jgi:hypothetical protein